MRLRGKGNNDAKAIVNLSGKILELPGYFEIAGNHVRRPRFAAKAAASRELKLEI